MKDLTLTELATLIAVFERAVLTEQDKNEQGMFERIKLAHAERLELESMDFDDCLGGACKL
ncbi:hypothetical protein [Neptunomonas japonica]|uniref:Uncharacterized protein n=1 Tax=Neptunomonas japonica JAMM 1380 TaxID=1441457 RepID=A0A7R6PQA9_9GAMM|nr:hypothetical protein [Neptunomonas japonica]BBB28445.1 conserved hypothetical protein [Neptunomonas japonica JAMM 1380]